MDISCRMNIIVAKHILTLYLLLILLKHLRMILTVMLEIQILADKLVFMPKYILEEISLWVYLIYEGLFSVTHCNQKVLYWYSLLDRVKVHACVRVLVKALFS